MFNSLLDYTKELEISADYTRQFVRKLQGGVRRLSNSIIKAEDDIKVAKNETNYAAKVKQQISKDSIKLSKQILFDATVNALKKSQEFDIPIYRRPLFEAIENNDTYFIRSRGTGFNSILSLDINLNKTAGRLDMWGTAIKTVRKQLGVKIPSKFSRKATREKSAIQASRAWAGIYSKRGVGANSKYMTTIKSRLAVAAKIAPFWELLDKGSIPFSSDRGGYPTPKGKSLNFVYKTEKQVGEQLNLILAQEKEKYKSLMFSYQIALNNANSALDQIAALVGEISIDSRKIGTLDKKADAIFKANYISKLQKVVQLIREGLLTTKKLQLAIKGSYRGKRFSTETMKGLLY